MVISKALHQGGFRRQVSFSLLFSILYCAYAVQNLLMILICMFSAALSYQPLTSIGYSAIILKKVPCCLSVNLWILFVLMYFLTISITCICNFVCFLHSGFLDDVFDVSRYWKSCKYLQPNCWLQSWLRREIQALMQVCIPCMKFMYQLEACYAFSESCHSFLVSRNQY